MVTFECPTCGRTFSVPRRQDAPHRPFCSERCKLVDLGRWLDGTYNLIEPLPGEAPTTPDRDPSDEE